MSECFDWNLQTNAIGMPLEEGLFSTLSYNVGDVIAQLHGEYITNQQYQKAGKRACLVIRLRK